MGYINQQAQKKTYTRFCAGAIISGIFSLVVIGMVCVFVFLPIFSYFNVSGQRIPLSGLDYVLYSLRGINSEIPYDIRLAEIDSYFALYNGQDALPAFLRDYHNILEMALSAFLLLSAIFSIICSIFGLIYLIAGKNRNNLMTSAMGSSALSFMALFLGLWFLYYFLCNKTFSAYRVPSRMRIDILALVYLAILGGASLTLTIVYNKCFRRRVFSSNKFDGNDQFNNQYESSLPVGLTAINDNAFAMNVKLRNAVIPDGITSLGQGAFSNCLYLQTVTIPKSVTQIGANCFYNTPNLKSITYLGSIQEWQQIYKGSNWISLSGAAYIDADNGRYEVG